MMLINLAINFFLDIAKEITTVVLTSYILSLLKTKKKNHSADQADGSSSDK